MVGAGGWRSVREALLDALAVVLPTECAGCGEHDRSCCAACVAALRPRVRSVPLTDPGGPPLEVFAAAAYDDVVRRVLLAMKDHERPELARWLAPGLGAAATAALGEVRATSPSLDGFAWCAVPSRPEAVRRRGYRPVPLLARRAGIPLSPLLASAPSASRDPAQKALGRAEREANVRGRFRVRRPVAGRRVVLLDDVLTTGSTLREAAGVLREAGAEVLGAAVVAVTPRHRPGTHDPPSGFITPRW